MAIVIRLSRQGRRNRPHYRLGVFDRRTRRDGPPIEYLGHYDPLETDDEKKVVLEPERISHWLGQGALVSETVRSFLRQKGIPMPGHRAGRRAKRKRKAGTTAKA
ncbi:MAG: 30S ribosomal protein S16 [Planctomycetota bacterium]